MISIMKESNHPKKRRSGRDFLQRGIILLIWILIWQGVSMIADNALLVASPMESLKALYGLLWEKDFWLSCLPPWQGSGQAFWQEAALLFSWPLSAVKCLWQRNF